MRRSRIKGLRVQDAMLAIAATAIGLAWAQAEWEPIQAFAGHFAERPSYAKWFLGDRPLYQLARAVIKDGLLVATAMACPWMVLLLFRGRRGGGHGRFWRARRPGAVACLAATFVLIFELAHQALMPVAAIHLVLFQTEDPPHARYLGWQFDTFDSLGNRSPMGDPLGTALIGMSRHAGLVVAGAWLALILAGAWRPEPSWIDRAGRTLGWFWIVAALAFIMIPSWGD